MRHVANRSNTRAPSARTVAGAAAHCSAARQGLGKMEWSWQGAGAVGAGWDGWLRGGGRLGQGSGKVGVGIWRVAERRNEVAQLKVWQAGHTSRARCTPFQQQTEHHQRQQQAAPLASALANSKLTTPA